MPNISKIKDKDTDIVYDIEDTVARSMGGLSNEAKQALLTCFQNVAWINASGQTYYDALETALYPPANLVSISATYIQSGDVYTIDTLDVLRPDLTVTGTFDDQSTIPITAYTLSGTLTEGTSTITVLYGGFTDTFTVTVTIKDTRELLYKWDFTKSLTDSVGGITMTLLNSNNNPSSLPTRDSTGLHFTAAEQVASCAINTSAKNGWSYELDIASAEFAGSAGNHKRLLVLNDGVDLIIFRQAQGLKIYRGNWINYTLEDGQTLPTSTNDFSGKTIKIHTSTSGTAYFYIDGVLLGSAGFAGAGYVYSSLQIGGHTTGAGTDGNQIHNMTITALRIYNEEAQ